MYEVVSRGAFRLDVNLWLEDIVATYINTYLPNWTRTLGGCRYIIVRLPSLQLEVPSRSNPSRSMDSMS